MSTFSHTLFNEVFIDVDKSAFMTGSLSPNFRYHGKKYDYIKQNYKTYSLDELKEILYMYRIKMTFADHKDKHITIPVFLHRDRIDTVIEFINDKLDEGMEESESESSGQYQKAAE